MAVKVDRTALLNVLRAVKPGLAAKEIVEEMTHFIFTGDNVVTYNDEICISHPFSTDFECSISAKFFYDGVSKSKCEEVLLDFEENQIRFYAEDQDFWVNSSTDEKVKDMAKEIVSSAEKLKWKPIPDNFSEAVFLCMFSASRDETKQSLKCLYIGNDSVYSCDTLRASKYVMNGVFDSPFMIRGIIAKELKEYTFSEYALSKSWAHFRTPEDVTFNVKQVIGDYPLEDVITALDLKGKEIALPKEGLKEAAEDLITWSEGEIEYHKTIEFHMEDNLVICQSKVKDLAGMTKKVKAEYSGEPITFLISPVFLAEILGKEASTMMINKFQAKFKAGNLLHVTMLNVE